MCSDVIFAFTLNYHVLLFTFILLLSLSFLSVFSTFTSGYHSYNLAIIISTLKILVITWCPKYFISVKFLWRLLFPFIDEKQKQKEIKQLAENIASEGQSGYSAV